jgi:hypothetical protein
MKRVLVFSLALLAVLPAGSAAHDGGGIDVMGGHAQIADLTLGSPLPVPVTPPENVSYVAGDNGFTGGHVVTEGDRLYLGSYGRGLHMYDISDPAAATPAGCGPSRRTAARSRSARRSRTRTTYRSTPDTGFRAWAGATSCCWPRAATTPAPATRAACS